MEWISVKDRLPELGQELIYWFPPFSKAYIGRFGGGDSPASVHFYSNQGFSTGDVTHWMPLPPPPNASTGRSDT